MCSSLIFKMNRRRWPVECLDLHIGGLKYNPAPNRQAVRPQILNDFMLGIDDDTFASRKFAKVYAMPHPGKSKLDPPMEEPLALQPFAHTCLNQQVHGPLLQNPGADTLFDAFAAGGFQDYRLDSVKVQQMRKHQPSGASSYNSDLCAHFHELMGLGGEGPLVIPVSKVLNWQQSGVSAFQRVPRSKYHGN